MLSAATVPPRIVKAAPAAVVAELSVVMLVDAVPTCLRTFSMTSASLPIGPENATRDDRATTPVCTAGGSSPNTFAPWPTTVTMRWYTGRKDCPSEVAAFSVSALAMRWLLATPSAVRAKSP